MIVRPASRDVQYVFEMVGLAQGLLQIRFHGQSVFDGLFELVREHIVEQMRVSA